MGSLLKDTVAWPKWVPILSWITGWVNVAGWVGNASPTSIYYTTTDSILGCADCGQFPFVESADYWDNFCHAPSKEDIICIASDPNFVTARLGL